MSRVIMTGIARSFGFPRVSGDEPSGGVAPAFGDAFSPRERG